MAPKRSSAGSGNAYTVSTLTAFGTDVTFNVQCGHDSYVAFVDLNIGTAGSAHAVEVIGGNVNFITCQVNGLDVFGNTTGSGLGSKYVDGPRSQRGASMNSYNDLAISTSSSAQCRVGAQFYASNLLCQGMQYLAQSASETIIATDAWLAVYSPNAAASGNGFDVLTGATVRCVGRVFGSTTATGSNSGIFVDAGGFFAYNTSAANRLPAITGATNDTKIGGTVKTYVQLPFIDTTNGGGIGGTTFPRG